MPITARVGERFRERVEEQSRKIKRRTQAAIVAYGVQVLTELIEQTPIKSGQARANWKVNINKRDDVFIELRETIALQRRVATADTPPDYFSTDDALLYGTSQAQAWESGDVMYIYNNAPYIERLNQGYSPQAPAGYIQQIIRDAKGELRSQLSTRVTTRKAR